MRNYDLSPLLRQWIGFDKLASSMQGGQESIEFPPYNIEKKDDNHYRITLALAGFQQSELEIEVEGPRLTVKGNPTPTEKKVEYLHQGLVFKPFSLSFTLAEHLHVSEAQFEHGLLHIDLVRDVPEALQPQRIAIGNSRPVLTQSSADDEA
ncbi:MULTISPECIES: small heat shock chaperone IbpB [unclassified Brenneria]|uniref:small heat shock chaperone IbpB n=1 Tax=unclassified Brenneria TaxID=2634434 RepID=UPI00155822B5|nr:MULTISPECIES: small heat shock chaperone IbpB [unclassified Brenneria]MBJ7223338.1 heat shock chaperone IbpB [Brenneria sp. L3-3C-1]MEE3644578.1 small heat shock chaperone IbpB [Brenneria sp. L3_3C_1]MEE3652140.1 small heat shock chaperone IbpB [Brenneria sp. HEZEL_4_2_4]NPD02099.1 heat shock chaperone IbpB [Brenneria sp. hezel4-2-4]